jgi:hypothetical protein
MGEDFLLDWLIRKLLGGKPEDEYRRTSPLKAAMIIGGFTAASVALMVWLFLSV